MCGMHYYMISGALKIGGLFGLKCGWERGHERTGSNLSLARYNFKSEADVMHTDIFQMKMYTSYWYT